MCGFLAFFGVRLDSDRFERAFATLVHRGPDNRRLVFIDEQRAMGFHRLAIRDVSHQGDQPFNSSSLGLSVVCNGEIYNDRQLKKAFARGYEFLSTSDCEVLLPLLRKHGVHKTAEMLDAEFAFVAYDHKTKEVMAARDPVGIRPMFYGYKGSGIVFASEAKALHDLCSEVFVFPPGYVYSSEQGFRPFTKISAVHRPLITDIDEALLGIKEKLVRAVEKRLHADVPVGFLLSGGLDSSLVCSLAARQSEGPIRTFAVGSCEDAIDIKYAEQVAKHIGSEHTNVYFTTDEVVEVLPDVIKHLETWDITTVRAAVGMYLVCRYIRRNTDVKVLLSGEVSDELFGYKYTDFAPSADAFQKEAEKRLEELYCYDVLRADRCIAAHSLEARVPFGDLEFVRHVMAIDPSLKINSYGKGKYLLRKAFADDNYLPHSLLMREKAAFSDAVGHSMVDNLKLLADVRFDDRDLERASWKYPFKSPFTKEALMYREIFEGFYPGRAALIKDYWMPNKLWENCAVDDPSARALPNYGASGS